MITCGPQDPGQLVTERLATYIDCHAQALAVDGFASIAGGWFGPALLWGCLTIYVALMGYRLVLGGPFGPRDAIVATLRAGVVIAFATSWSAYGTVIYQVVSDGPAEMASQLMPGEPLDLSLQEMAKRIDQDYAELQTHGVAVTLPRSPPPRSNAPAAAAAPKSPPVVFGPDPVFSHGGLVLVALIVGSLGALKLASGILLGSGPLFVTLGLFDLTVGLLVGWARALLGVFVGLTGGLCLTALELGFIEAQLQGAAFGQNGLLGEPLLTAAAVIFGMSMIVVLIVAFAVGCSLRVPFPHAASGPQIFRTVDAVARTAVATPLATDGAAFQPASRAQSVADAVRRLGDRESAMATRLASAAGVGGLRPVAAATGERSAVGLVGSGRDSVDHSRRLVRARTPSIARRDRL